MIRALYACQPVFELIYVLKHYYQLAMSEVTLEL